jgi:hypothetical protein
MRRGQQGSQGALSHHERAVYDGPLTLNGLGNLGDSMTGKGSANRGNSQQGSIRPPVDGLQGRLDVEWRLHEPPLAGTVRAQLPRNGGQRSVPSASKMYGLSIGLVIGGTAH